MKHGLQGECRGGTPAASNPPEFENRRKREIAEKEKSRAKRAGKKQKRMHESKDLSKNRAINLIFLQKSVDKREDILHNYSST